MTFRKAESRHKSAAEPAAQCSLAYATKLLTFTGLADGTGPLVYQWLFNGVTVAGATNTTCLISNIYYTNAGFYTLRATNLAGNVLSSAAELKVRPRFVGAYFFSPEAISVNYEGGVGKTYSIDVSSTLTNWASIGVVSNSSILMQYQQTNSSTPDGVPRLYRLRQVP